MKLCFNAAGGGMWYHDYPDDARIFDIVQDNLCHITRTQEVIAIHNNHTLEFVASITVLGFGVYIVHASGVMCAYRRNDTQLFPLQDKV